MASASSRTPPRPLALYSHIKAQHWGLAILAWDRGRSRGYQFEDGIFRIINENYYRLIEEIDTPADTAAQVITDLRRKLGDDADHHLPVHTAPAAPELSFDDQVRAFSIRYPEGFADRAWIARHRRRTDGRRTKGHVEPAFAEARAALGEDALDRALAAGEASKVAAAAIEVLQNTNLLTEQQLRPLRAIAPARHVHFCRTLRELLHGTDAYELRFERFVATLTQGRGPVPSWPLATALPALFWPEQHVYVKEATFRQQAKWMAPRLILTSTPGGSLYMRLADMARTVQTSLERAGLAPRDLMDVHEFMVMTLAPSARKRLGH